MCCCRGGANLYSHSIKNKVYTVFNVNNCKGILFYIIVDCFVVFFILIYSISDHAIK